MESTEEDKKNLAENLSHFKTAGLNCHLEVPASFLCWRGSVSGLGFQAPCITGDECPLLRQTNIKKVLDVNVPNLSGTNVCKLSTETFGIWYPLLNKRILLSFRAPNIGLATRMRITRVKQTASAWCDCNSLYYLVHCGLSLFCFVTSLWEYMRFLFTKCA